jgi:hypothetical protein
MTAAHSTGPRWCSNMPSGGTWSSPGFEAEGVASNPAWREPSQHKARKTGRADEGPALAFEMISTGTRGWPRRWMVACVDRSSALTKGSPSGCRLLRCWSADDWRRLQPVFKPSKVAVAAGAAATRTSGPPGRHPIAFQPPSVSEVLGTSGVEYALSPQVSQVSGAWPLAFLLGRWLGGRVPHPGRDASSGGLSSSQGRIGPGRALGRSRLLCRVPRM